MSGFKSNHLFSSRSCEMPEKCDVLFEVLFTFYNFMTMCFQLMRIYFLLLPPQSLSFLNKNIFVSFICNILFSLDGNCSDMRYFHLVTLSANSIFFSYSCSLLIFCLCFDTYSRIQHMSTMKLKMILIHWSEPISLLGWKMTSFQYERIQFYLEKFEIFFNSWISLWEQNQHGLSCAI